MGTYVLTKICICKQRFLSALTNGRIWVCRDYTHLDCPANSLVLEGKGRVREIRSKKTSCSRRKIDETPSSFRQVWQLWQGVYSDYVIWTAGARRDFNVRIIAGSYCTSDQQSFIHPSAVATAPHACWDVQT